MHRRTFLQMAALPAAAAGQSVSTASSGRMKVGTQHGSSDDILRVIGAFGVNHICSSSAFGKIRRELVGRRADQAARARGVVRHQAGGRAAAAQLQLHHQGRKSEHHAGQEPRARSRDRQHLPDDPQLRQGRHSRGQVQHDHPGRGPHRNHAGPRPRALQHLRLRSGQAGAAAHRSRPGERRDDVGAHHLFPAPRGSGGRRVQSEDGLPSARSGDAERSRLSRRASRARAASTGSRDSSISSPAPITGSTSARARCRRCSRIRRSRSTT